MTTGRLPWLAANRTTSPNSEAGVSGGVLPVLKGVWDTLATRQPPVL